jgi:uncharacterized protein (TIGR03435 family)
MRRGIVVLLLIGLAAGVRGEQDARTERPSFEVASVRPNPSPRPTLTGIRTGNEAVIADNATLRSLIGFAYALREYQKLEGTSPLLDQRFDVNAKAPGAPPARRGELGPMNLMMQSLLAERFKLAVRWEDRTRTGYALVKARADGRLGPRLRPSEIDCQSPEALKVRQIAEDPVRCSLTIMNNEMRTAGHRLSVVTVMLSQILQQPVLDKTGLSGLYAINMTFDQAEFAPRGPVPPVQAAPTGLPSLFTAVVEQLGLRLEQERMTVPTLIVTHVEPPSGN